MYLVLSIFLMMDVILMTAWQILDPLHTKREYFPHEKPELEEDDVEIKPYLEYCNSQHMNIWLGM